MNVQISPLQTPPVGDDELDDTPGGHTRTYLIGGVALALALGGFWYFTHDSGTLKPKRDLAAPVKVAAAETRDMAVIEHTIGTVMANSTVQVNARVQGADDTRLLQGRPDGQEPAIFCSRSIRAPTRPLSPTRRLAGRPQGQGRPL